jgi:hypothetical protein
LILQARELLTQSLLGLHGEFRIDDALQLDAAQSHIRIVCEQPKRRRIDCIGKSSYYQTMIACRNFNGTAARDGRRFAVDGDTVDCEIRDDVRCLPGHP